MHRRQAGRATGTRCGSVTRSEGLQMEHWSSEANPDQLQHGAPAADSGADTAMRADRPPSRRSELPILIASTFTAEPVQRPLELWMRQIGHIPYTDEYFVTVATW